MGCGSSTGIPKNSYPKQAAPVHTNYGRCPPVSGGPISSGDGLGDDGFVAGMMVGGAMGYGGGGGMMGGGMMGGGGMMAGGYHVGPVMPEHSVTIAGVDVM